MGGRWWLQPSLTPNVLNSSTRPSLSCTEACHSNSGHWVRLTHWHRAHTRQGRIHVSLSLSLFLCLFLSLCFCVCVSLFLCVCVCVSLCFCVCVCVSLCFCVFLSLSLSLCFCVCVCLSLCFCVCVSLSLSLSHYQLNYAIPSPIIYFITRWRRLKDRNITFFFSLSLWGCITLIDGTVPHVYLKVHHN